jgi:DNA replication and repair protein RecF
VRIANIQIKNFRCFDSLDLSFESHLILIVGINGAGKTSLLEALHYLCYMRSFRTHLPQELVQFGYENFFIKARLESSQEIDSYDLQVGFSNKKRLVKVNNKSIASYKELLDYYRIVTLTEDDLALIKDGPEGRRLFIDQAIILHNADFVITSKKCRDIVENRNALLKRGGSLESYLLWSGQLWDITQTIQAARIMALTQLEQEVRELIQIYFDNQLSITFKYTPKKAPLNSWDAFFAANPTLYTDEQRFCRSIFGAHLDDFTIQFQEVKSKNFASRGQQKLIIVLLKAAQIKLLAKQQRPAILLLDDFMTDFDQARSQILIKLLVDLKIQLIFTIPTFDSYLEKELIKQGAIPVKLTD